jgi:NAD(P)H-hydrate epimerase
MTTVTISRDQARELDRRAVVDYGMASIVLMENAGRGVADRLCQLGIAGPVFICCGGGNNGGDGFVVARHLDLRGYEVRVLLLGDPAKLGGDAAATFQIIERSGLRIVRADDATLERELADASWIVDALLGTGASGEPRPPMARAIDLVNASGRPILAVDVPSGLDCDTGRPSSHTIKAAHTCTFVAAKPGFLLPEAAPYVGVLHVLDIGAPRKLVDEILTAAADQTDSSS